MEKYIMPKRIVCEENTEGSENIFIERPLQASFSDVDGVLIKKNGYILLDFGKELSGGIIFTVRRTSKGDDTAKCRLVFGESVMEALSHIGHKNATNNHSVRDTVIDVGYLSTYRYGTTGFRFVKIEAVDGDILLSTVKAETDIRDLEYKGSFECNDSRLNEIWRVGAYTVLLNMHEFLWDGVKRDRLVWIGDMHPEVSTIRTVFGNDECVRRSLDFVKNGTPPDKWMNKTATYSMWWIIIHYDLFMQWGDIDYLNEQREYLEKLVERAIVWIDEYVADTGMEGFVDWSTKYDLVGEDAGRKAIFILALECAAKLFEVFGNDELLQKCKACVKKLREDKLQTTVNKRMSALTVLAKRVSDTAEEVLSGNSAKEMSCFMGYYVLKAKAMLSDYADALDIIRMYWGAMLDMGATTFWEDFDIDWIENAGRIDEITPSGKKDIHGDFGKNCYIGFRHSLCHGWASGPTPFLMEQIGGIEILEPGCKKVRISPNLGNLEWIKISYPTPYGNIKIFAEQKDGRLVTKTEVPDGIELVE